MRMILPCKLLRRMFTRSGGRRQWRVAPFAVSVLLSLPAAPGHAQSAWDKIKQRAKETVQQQVNGTTQPRSGSTQPASSAGGGNSPAAQPASGSPVVHAGDPNNELYLRSVEGDAQGCEAAFAKGADPSRASLSTYMDAPYKTNLATVRCLVEHGVDPKARRGTGSQLGPTPLEVAVTHNYDDIAAYLIGKGADVNDRAQSRRTDRPSGTLLQTAASQGNVELVKLLLQHGANASPSMQSPDGQEHGSMLDSVMVYMSGSVSNNIHPTLASQQKVEQMCEIVGLLEAHGARRTAASANLKGEEQCGRSAAEKQQTLAALQTQQTQQDQQQLVNNRVSAHDSCARSVGSFYDCSCFADKVMAYREQHPVREPVMNTFSKVDFNSCVGPSEPMVEWGRTRGLKVLEIDKHTPEQKQQIAQCAGQGLATIFQAHPTINVKVINDDFMNAMTGCNR